MTTQDMVCCPFCGSEDVHLGHGRFDEWFVECYKCHACGPWFCLADRSEAQESAVFFWNAYGKVSDFVQQSHINRDRWLSARYAIEAWLIKHKEAFARLGVSSSRWFVEKNDDVAAIGKSCEELADKLNPWWRVQLYVEHPEQMTMLASSEPGPLWYAKLRKALEPIKEALADESVLGFLQSTMQVHGGQEAIDDLRAVFATEPECSATELCLVVEKPRKPHSVGDALADEELLEVIERWQLASGLCSPAEEHGGDPGGVTPEMAQQHWEEVEKQRDEFQGKLAEADHALIQAGVGEDSSVAVRIEKLSQMVLENTRFREVVSNEMAVCVRADEDYPGATVEFDIQELKGRLQKAIEDGCKLAMFRANVQSDLRIGMGVVETYPGGATISAIESIRKRAEKAERELDAARDSKNKAIFEIHRGHANDLADALGCVNEHEDEGARQQPPWAEMIGMVERIRRERDEVLASREIFHCPQCGEMLTGPSGEEALAKLANENASRRAEHAEGLMCRMRTERDVALARVRKLEAEVRVRDEQLAAARIDLNRLAAACGAENPPGPPDLPERVKADTEELAAFRWLKCWCADRGRMLRFALGNRIGIVGLDGDTWQPTPVALADNLDPNWRQQASPGTQLSDLMLQIFELALDVTAAFDRGEFYQVERGREEIRKLCRRYEEEAGK